MLIDPTALAHWINNFYGYGSWQAKFWFVGYEENGGDVPEEVAEKLNYFYGLPASPSQRLSDIRELYRRVAFRIEGPRAAKFATLHDHRFGPHAVLHGAWKNLIAFEYGFYGEEIPDLLTVQQKSFVSPLASREALIQLYPLPSHSHAWHYAWLDLPGFPFLRTRAAYQTHVYRDRIQTILQNARKYKPEVVLLYGMDNISQLKQSVLSFFPDASFRQVKAVPQRVPQHHRADIPGTVLLITTQIPALRHNRKETGFDWYEFGKRVKTETE